MAASPASTAHWERLLRETFLETAIPLRPGPTAMAISGCLAAMASTQPVRLAISTTYGSSIYPRTYGRGWAEATRSERTVASLECTAHWERLPRETFREAAIPPRPGPTAAAIFGSSAAEGTIRQVPPGAISMTCGSSIPPPTNGPG